MMRHTIAAMRKDAPAVINHPPITEMTPVTLNTALSLLQALSAKLEPIATIKVTSAVERGNLKVGPSVRSMDERTSGAAARTKANAAVSSAKISVSWAKLLLIQLL